MKKRIERVRTELVMYYPFIAALLFGLEQVVDNTMKNIAAVSTRQLFLNTDLIKERGLDNQDLLFVLAHEALHPALMHLQRRGNRIPALWNIAADAVVNYYSTEMGIPPIAGTVPPIAGKDVETIYAELLEIAQPCPSCGGLSVEIGSDGEISSPSFSVEPGKSMDNSSESCPTCNGSMNFDEHLTSASTEADAEATRWQQKALSAAHAAKRNRGTVPGHFEEQINELVAAKVDWRTALSTWMQATKGDDDNRWVPPKKNRMHLGYLPSHFSERCDCVIGVDTSGSISSKELQQALSEIVSLASLYCDSLKVITFDTIIHNEFDIVDGEGLDAIKMRGRGGTDFRPFFERLDDVTCDVAIVFTDTFGPFPASKPLTPTILAGPEENNDPPPWAKYILINA